MSIFAYPSFDLVECSNAYMVMHQICNRASFDEGTVEECGASEFLKIAAILSPRCVQLCCICHVLRQRRGTKFVQELLATSDF